MKNICRLFFCRTIADHLFLLAIHLSSICNSIFVKQFLNVCWSVVGRFFGPTFVDHFLSNKCFPMFETPLSKWCLRYLFPSLNLSLFSQLFNILRAKNVDFTNGLILSYFSNVCKIFAQMFKSIRTTLMFLLT